MSKKRHKEFFNSHVYTGGNRAGKASIISSMRTKCRFAKAHIDKGEMEQHFHNFEERVTTNFYKAYTQDFLHDLFREHDLFEFPKRQDQREMFKGTGFEIIDEPPTSYIDVSFIKGEDK